MSAVLSAQRRQRAREQSHLSHQTDGPTFMNAFCDAPLMRAFASDRELQMLVDRGMTSRSFVVLKAERDLDTGAASALMAVLRDYLEGKAQTQHERAIGKWLSAVIDQSVERAVDHAEDAGEFLYD